MCELRWEQKSETVLISIDINEPCAAEELAGADCIEGK